MTNLDVERTFKQMACARVELAPDGPDKFVVHTPFKFDDGDHFVVILKKTASGWVLTDEGHTLMHLTYSGFRMNEPRAAMVARTLRAAEVENLGGELRLPVFNDDFGDALFDFLQALTRVTEITKWTREQVRSTFAADFRELISAILPPSRIQFDYADPAHDLDGKYKVDCKVNGMARPLYIFAVGSDGSCKDATISIHQLREWDNEFDSMAIFQDQSSISRATLARFSDVVGKQFSSIRVRDEIADYLRSHVPGLNGEARPGTSIH
ncbi:MAG TPA: DUF1828 domain-containing protein [Bryobacteraceae bacterium]|nr:DUF1828 domain-containing protein [Bryobacteraceae bacterium]